MRLLGLRISCVFLLLSVTGCEKAGFRSDRSGLPYYIYVPENARELKWLPAGHPRAQPGATHVHYGFTELFPPLEYLRNVGAHLSTRGWFRLDYHLPAMGGSPYDKSTWRRIPSLQVVHELREEWWINEADEALMIQLVYRYEPRTGGRSTQGWVNMVHLESTETQEALRRYREVHGLPTDELGQPGVPSTSDTLHED